MNRRYFIASTAAAVSTAPKAIGANGKIRIAIAGVRGRGRHLTNEFSSQPDVDVVYLCDPDSNVFGRALEIIERKKKPKPQLVADLRRVLDDKTIDAIVIATPDHWHAPATILACNAGKDVYVEKPASHNAREGRLMIEAARHNKRIVQLGTQARSNPTTRALIEYVHSGKIGKVLMAKAWNVQLRDDIGRMPDSPVPPGVDYDIWTGPASLLPFNENRFHYKWHWNWNYGTGDVGNDGVHQMDQARWALGMDKPVVISGMGRKIFFNDDQVTPDTVNVTFDYGSTAMIFEMRIWNPYGMNGATNSLAVYGTEGMVEFKGPRVLDHKGKDVPVDFPKTGADEKDLHVRNFLDCMRSRKAPNAEIEIGHTSSLHCHLANIVVKTGRNICFDPASETIKDDASANALLCREYRSHWSVPKGV